MGREKYIDGNVVKGITGRNREIHKGRQIKTLKVSELTVTWRIIE